MVGPIKILKENLLELGFYIENKKYIHGEGYRFDLNEQILYHHNSPDIDDDYFCLKPDNIEDIRREINLGKSQEEAELKIKYIINLDG